MFNGFRVLVLCADGFRYCNMDYVAMSALQSYKGCTDVFFSYDIACQWHVKLHEWRKRLPKRLRCDWVIKWDHGIPKLHCKAPQNDAGHRQRQSAA